MARLFLASNYVLLGGGHLQIVYQGNDGSLREVEVQGPGNGFFGHWLYPDFGRDHVANTPYYGQKGMYKAVEITGRDADAVWQVLGQLDASFASLGADISYDFAQNSNSFVATMLWAVGLQLSQFTMTTGKITFFPGDTTNVLHGAHTDAGQGQAVALNVALTGFDDVLHCGIGNDTIGGANGTAGNDSVWLGAGDDVVQGGAGRDVMWGEAGSDTMTGGSGADQFMFAAARQSRPGDGADVIADFQGRDRIDLHLMDADADLAGDQAFVVADRAAAHAVWWGAAGRNAVTIAADLNGDTLADFGIVVHLRGGLITDSSFVL